MFRRAMWVVGVVFLGAWTLIAQVPPEDRIRITDPDRLEALGFARDATNIFVVSKANLGGGQAQDAASLPDETETWGGATGYTSIPGFMLQSESWVTRLDRLPGYTHCVLGTVGQSIFYPTFAQAPIEAPEGANLGFLKYWAHDSSPDLDLVFRVYETCQAAPTGSPANTTLLGEGFTFASIGEFNFFASLHNTRVNNRDCFYFVQVEFAPDDEVCQPHLLRVRKFQVSWTRQVSPAPATASFTDVPTTHPFFRFIEALKDSGITGGCNTTPPQFCPNNPITRGEMAVFLAAALGLSWP